MNKLVLVLGVSIASVFLLFLFPLALYVNVMSLIDGVGASNGSAGTPGTVTVEEVRPVRGGGEPACIGTFVPDSGGPSVEVRVQVPGECAVGQQEPARLTAARSTLIDGYKEPQAWVEGSKDWVPFLLLTGLFAVLNLPLIVFAVTLAVKLPKKMRVPPREA